MSFAKEGIGPQKSNRLTEPFVGHLIVEGGMMKEVLRSAAGGRMPSPDEVPGAPSVFDVPLEAAVLVGFVRPAFPC